MSSDITDAPVPPGPGGGPAVEYELTADDFIALHLWQWDQAVPPGRVPIEFALVLWLVSLVLVAGAVAAIVVTVTRPTPFVWEPELLTHLALPVGAVLLLLAWWATTGPAQALRRLARWSFHQRLRRVIQQGYVAGHYRHGRRDRVTLDEGGFTEVNEFRESDGGVDIVEHKTFRVSWEAVGGFQQTDERLFVVVLNKGYLIVPRWAFADGAAEQRFVAELGRRLRERSPLTQYDRVLHNRRSGPGEALGPTDQVRRT
jgi:hypothetical protein